VEISDEWLTTFSYIAVVVMNKSCYMKYCLSFLIRLRTNLFISIFLIVYCPVKAQQLPAKMEYTVSMEKPADQLYHVELTNKVPGEQLDFKMCAWTPGYYQIMDFWKNVQNFKVTDQDGRALIWSKTANTIWRVKSENSAVVKISYDVRASVLFVANNYLDENRGYIIPGGLFMYLDQELRHPVTVKIKPYSKWPGLFATGLDTVHRQNHVYYADNFDVLYDSPILMGRLEVFPAFIVSGKPHYFIAYDMPATDKEEFMNNLQKIVETGSRIIGDVPYTHYSFLSIGKGGGGIEHLNSASLSFSEESFRTAKGRERMYNFIAHEYFHTFNVKRIRPIELGPFDYSKETHTNMLWVSEGFTSYYENLISTRAGLQSAEGMLENFQSYIQSYENKPGHLYQSATQASYNTWNDGFDGQKNGEIDKTISYYDKGAVLGLMLDFNIRHITQNRKSLDDLMRQLYSKYYKKLNRGFTEREFQTECEQLAGVNLQELFDYASTVKAPDYPKYFAYGGLKIDTISTAIYNTAWTGMHVRPEGNILNIVAVDWNSPAWKQGVRANTRLLNIDGLAASAERFKKILADKIEGDTIRLTIDAKGRKQDAAIVLNKDIRRTFKITQIEKPNTLQKTIYHSWVKN
jgi:predicted metalloprotease with PDZ domain